MRRFKEVFEDLGYTFQSADVLEDVYTFYKFYDNEANKGVASILLKGDPGSGKTYLSEIFHKYLGKGSEYIYTQCVEETNSDRLIATINVYAMVTNDGERVLAEGVLTKAINLANAGKKVVLTVDELDKAREALDSYFLDFLQSGRIETSNNEILSLTEEGRKNLFVIFAMNDQREALEAFLSRCSVIKLPPMPPVLAYKTLLRKFDGNDKHDPKFLKFLCKVYEAIYNEQMASNEELLNRLPALRELVYAITSDYVLYVNGISSTRRIKKLSRNLGKDDRTYQTIIDILTKNFKYHHQESNYSDETLDLDMSDPNNYMSTRDAESLVEQYIEKKDNGEYIFDEDEFDDPMKDIASILDNMKEDQALTFLDRENKEKIVELGVITHQDPRALEILFDKIKFRGNPNSRFGFLYFENDLFIGLMKYKNTLILIANKEYVSPRLLIRGLCTIMSIIYDCDQNIDVAKYFYFGESVASKFKLTGLNAKILSNAPKLVLDKMRFQNGVHIYQASNLKVTYDDSLNISYFRYLQKYNAEPLYEVIEKICRFNPELAIPASFIGAERFEGTRNRDLIRRLSDFESEMSSLERFKKAGWEVQIDDFIPMELTYFTRKQVGSGWNEEFKMVSETDKYVFDWYEDKDKTNKKIHVYPKYALKNGFLMYTLDEDFLKDQTFLRLDPFQKEIALLARSIFGNFIPYISREGRSYYFSSLTMSKMGRIVEDESNRQRVMGIDWDIVGESDFTSYYDSISQPAAVVMANRVLKRTLNNGKDS